MKTQILLISSLLLIACSKDEPETVNLSVSANKTQVRIGEPVTFSIQHNVNALSIYTGEAGHNYQKSIDYVLRGKSSAELQEHNYRPTAPEVKHYQVDFSTTEIGSTTLANGTFEMRNANSGDNLVGSQAEVVTDATIGKKVLKVNAQHPNWWYEALRLNVNTKVGSNKKMTLRMKYATTILKSANDQSEHPEESKFPIVIRVAGIAQGETAVTFKDDTVWDLTITPKTEYTDYTFDIGRTIEAWESAVNKKMATLSYIQVLFTTVGAGIGYIGDYYVQSASFGAIDYFPFDTGKGITITDNSGIAHYTHTYTQAGTYEVVVIGNSSGFKSYKGDGYKTDVGVVSANEYKYNNEYRTIKITVTP
ncbi:DUF5017 domain-containing protein [Capnocytophaga leadbetteri]|uniref:DUF5017 domain-containing protein n=1 Tax=Capnocytophaga leadbetteri TaxID=327575 RepID=UPI0028E4211B|nr:DUF5017 domain-containing protein [Capnocytophaga leadbetteri]